MSDHVASPSRADASFSDNPTPHVAFRYSAEVRRTLPHYELLVSQVVDVALTWTPTARRWLDTGTGTGYCVSLARERLPLGDFYVADPSTAMLEVARSNLPWLASDRFLLAASRDLPVMPAFDVVTAVQCHHYGSVTQRLAALERCRDLLRPDGVIVVSENVRAETTHGHDRARGRWHRWLLGAGRSTEEAHAQLQREGEQFFPIRPSEHLALFEQAGLRDAELVFRNYSQAIFAARR